MMPVLAEHLRRRQSFEAGYRPRPEDPEDRRDCSTGWAAADVVVENAMAGAGERLGLDEGGTAGATVVMRRGLVWCGEDAERATGTGIGLMLEKEPRVELKF